MPEDKARYNASFGTGCSDMGDISCVMPAVHPHIGGMVGHSHGNDLFITDPYLATVVSAKIQAESAVRLLEDDAALAKKIVAEYVPVYASTKEYLDAMDKLTFTAQAVRYDENGDVTLHYKN